MGVMSACKARERLVAHPVRRVLDHVDLVPHRLERFGMIILKHTPQKLGGLYAVGDLLRHDAEVIRFHDLSSYAIKRIASFAAIYPISPQHGKVSTHVSTSSFTVDQLTRRTLLAAPTPMMAVVFVCVVLTGTPATDEISRQTVPRVRREALMGREPDYPCHGLDDPYPLSTCPAP